MKCNNCCKLCNNLIISQDVTFAAGVLTINLPAGAYNNCEKYCIIVAQAIPAATTLISEVVITIGDGTEVYPLVDRCCAPVQACSINTRTRYPVRVVTDATGGTFKLLCDVKCRRNNALRSIDGTVPATEGGAG
jgi:hypothetical protein